MVHEPDPDDERLLGLIRESISAPPRWDQYGEPLTAESVRKAMDEYWTRQQEMRPVVSPNVYRRWLTSLEAEVPPITRPEPIDLKALAASLRAALDEHTVFVPPDVFHEAKALEEEYARLRVVCSSAVPQGCAYLVNDSQIERFIRKAATPMTFTYLPDTEDETFRYRAQWGDPMVTDD